MRLDHTSLTRRDWLAGAALALPLAGFGRPARAQSGASLSFYTSMPSDDARVLTDAFASATGIAVRTWRSSSEQLAQRTIAETQSGRQAFDAVESHSAALEPLRQAGAFRSLKDLPDFDPDLRVTPTHGQWTGTRYSVFSCAWNTSLVQPEEVPNTYADLLHSRWRGRIALEVDNHAWFGAMHKALGQEAAERWFGGLASQGLLVRKGHSLVANMLAAGEIPLSLHVYTYKASQLEARGAPVKHRLLSPTLTNAGSLAVARDTRQAEAVSRFVRFMQGPGQPLLASLHHVPAVSAANGAALDASRFVHVDTELTEGANGRRWRTAYQDFLRKAAAGR